MCLTLTATLLTAVPARAEQPDPVRLAAKQPASVDARPVKAKPRPKDLTQGAGPQAVAPPVWPATATAPVSLTSPDAQSARRLGESPGSLSVRAGTLPVWVGSPGAATRNVTAAAAPAEVSHLDVQVLGRDATPQAWKDGLLLRLKNPDTTTYRGRVNVSVDYSSFANAYGGDWSTRLRLVALPECALTPGTTSTCRPQDLPSHNDTNGQRVSADVDLRPESSTDKSNSAGVLLALTAAPSGSTGDYTATPLQASSTWSAGGYGGDFSWSYPMRTPPALGGPEPRLSLSYTASSVDGRSDASNNQPSWLGEGFEYWPGFIERRYKSCHEDKGGSANNTTDTYDLCWGTDNAVMAINGASTELVRDDTTGTWKPKVDNGSRIERLTNTTNADNNNEYWKITDAEGTQYFFGLNRLKGWTTGKPTTNSTWTVPVAGNNTGEPCRAATYVDSFCDQAWRWNLDYVVDVHGNTMSMWYTPQSNKYARNLTATDDVSYHRGGVLNRIDYGTDNRAGVDTAYTATTPPMRVLFTVADRCLTNCDNDENWKDTPKDQECTGTSCEDNYSPTFWITSRLAKVTTQVWDPTLSPAAYRDVDSWQLTHTFPPNGDASRDGMWLDSIVKSGHVGLPAGTGDQLPEINFDFVAKANRVDAQGDDQPPMNWLRMGTIWTETGGKISVTYSDPECVIGTTMPASPQTNTRRCYPVLSEDPYTEELETEYFHKYVVTQVTEADLTGGGTDKVTRYEYLGGAAWRHTDDDGLTKDKFRTWADYRGYAKVRVRQGVPGQDTLTESHYFRGMHGDKAAPSGGTRDITLPAVDLNGDGDTTDVADAPQVKDHDAWAGMVRQQTVYNGVDTDVVSTSVTEPWQSSPTASRDMGQTTVHARHSGTKASWAAVKLDAGRGWRVTKNAITFDQYGAPVSVDNLGDVAVVGDETCVRTTYARNPTINLLALTARVQTFALPCGQNPTSADDIIGDARSSYDGNAHYADGQTGGTPPTKGNLTTSEALRDWSDANGGTTVWQTISSVSYDDYGRVHEAWDVRGNKTTNTYTPATGGPVTNATKIQTAGSLIWTSSATVEPAWGIPTVNLDINSRRTELAYDPHGRLIKVWLPNRLRSSNPTSPSSEFTYTVRNAGGVNAVTTKALNPAGNYVSTYALYDGLLRPRQTQRPALAGTGTILTQTAYDAAGRVVTTTDNYHDHNLTPSGDLHTIDDWEAAAQTSTLYDRAGRVTSSILRTSVNEALVEKWRTTTGYGGDRTYVTPPEGGTATTTIVDARGNTIEHRQHTARDTTAAFDATTYTFNRKNQLTAVTDSAGNEWTYQYDIRGRQIATDDPDKGLTTTSYNDYGDVEETVDAAARARDAKLVYSYDPLGRRTGVYDNTISDTTRRVTLAYDPTGARGQLASTSRWAGANRTDEYKVRVRGYTALYQPTGEDYIIPAAETGLAGTYTFTRQYKPDGSIATESFPNVGGLGGETVTHVYDDVTGLPERLTTNMPGAGQYVTESLYTAYGELALVRYQQLAQNWLDRAFEYDDVTRRLTRATTARQTAPQYVSDIHYTYDNAGNVERIADTPAGGTSDVQCFDHDYLRRLTQAWTPATGDCGTVPQSNTLGGPAPYWSTWTFDPVGTDSTGNLLQHTNITPAGTTGQTFTYPTPGSSQPHTLTSVTTTGIGAGTKTYRYDETGNTTCRPRATTTTNTCPPGTNSQQLTWDIEGHLTAVTDGTNNHSYLYSGDGTRLIARDPTGATLYLPGHEIRYTAATAQKTATRYYSWAGETCAMRQTGTGFTWLVTDHQGTQSTAIAAGNQAITKRRQTPYGTPRGTNPTWPNDRGFVGGVIDGEDNPTGLTHIGARSYDPAIARFISVDPIIDFTNPLQMHGYSYASNSPITHSDPTGLVVTPGNGEGGSPNNPGPGPAPNPPPTPKPDSEPDQKSKCGNWAIWCKTAKKALDSTVDWARDNAKIVGTVAGITAGVVTTGACLGFTAGIGSIGCAAIGGFVGGAFGSIVEDTIDRKDDSWQDIAGGALFYGLVGAAAGAGGAALGPVLFGGSVALHNGMGVKAAFDFGRGALKDPVARTAAGAGTAAPKPKVPSTKNGCHSFDPTTPVVLANGTTRAIGDIKIGDEVLAHDPETGDTDGKQVEQLHINQDTHLTDLTINVEDQGQHTLHTTQNHPFWSTTRHTWIDAAELEPGERLRSDDDHTEITVVHAHNYTGSETMRDLTVADIHTYYVIAGDAPVLVHNCGNGNLQSGNSPAASRGTSIHNGSEWGEHLDSLGYQRGRPLASGDVPDGFTDNGFPVELKPDSRSGIRAGTRQLRRYMNQMGVDYGELWTYKVSSSGDVTFRLTAVPKSPFRWMKW